MTCINILRTKVLRMVPMTPRAEDRCHSPATGWSDLSLLLRSSVKLFPRTSSFRCMSNMYFVICKIKIFYKYINRDGVDKIVKCWRFGNVEKLLFRGYWRTFMQYVISISKYYVYVPTIPEQNMKNTNTKINLPALLISVSEIQWVDKILSLLSITGNPLKKYNPFKQF